MRRRLRNLKPHRFIIYTLRRMLLCCEADVIVLTAKIRALYQQAHVAVGASALSGQTKAPVTVVDTSALFTSRQL